MGIEEGHKLGRKEAEGMSDNIRLIIQKTDGSYSYLEGEDLKKWESIMNDLVAMDESSTDPTTQVLEELQWKTASVEEIRELLKG